MGAYIIFELKHTHAFQPSQNVQDSPKLVDRSLDHYYKHIVCHGDRSLDHYYKHIVCHGDRSLDHYYKHIVCHGDRTLDDYYKHIVCHGSGPHNYWGMMDYQRK